jgi:hypothetical protein
MRQMWKAAGLAAVILLLMWGGRAAGSTYTGRLAFAPPADSSDGLVLAGTKWPTYSAIFSWAVSDTDTSHPGFGWKYEYEFKLSSAKLQSAFSHVIIETSTAFNPTTDMLGLTGARIESYGNQAVRSGNPNMPADAWGLRFVPTGETYDMKWSFYSNRAPVWGDFYAKGGSRRTDTAYNRGFTANDVDPTSPAADGSAAFHILRPDTEIALHSSLGAVPLPPSLWAGGVLMIICAVVRQVKRARE